MTSTSSTLTTTPTPTGRVRALVSRRPLPAFFALAYTLSWTAWVPCLLSEDGLGAWTVRFLTIFGDSGQLTGIGPGAYLGPFTAALVVTALADGRAGLRVWRHRLTRPRVAPRWYAFALQGYPAVVLASAVVNPGAGAPETPSASTFALLVPGLLMQSLTSGEAEEPGWRDFAQPRIRQRPGPLRGTVILGVLWGGWHLPLFWTDWPHGRGDPAAIAGFTLGAVAFSIVIAWAFNRSGESLPITILLDAGNNNVLTILGHDMFPNLRPHANFLTPSIGRRNGLGRGPDRHHPRPTRRYCPPRPRVVRTIRNRLSQTQPIRAEHRSVARRRHLVAVSAGATSNDPCVFSHAFAF